MCEEDKIYLLTESSETEVETLDSENQEKAKRLLKESDKENDD